MKKIILLGSLFVFSIINAQNGSSKGDAILVSPQTNCILETFSNSSRVIWHKFVATSEDVNINVETQQFGNNSPHIHYVSIFEGNNDVEKTHDALPFENQANKMNINLNASKLIVGETYYLKLEREAHHEACDKDNCRNINASNLATYKICVEELTVIIPPDYNLEKPAVAYALDINKGQLLDTDGQPANDVFFYNNKVNPAIYITNSIVGFAFEKINQEQKTYDVQRVDMVFVNSLSEKRVLKSEELDFAKNYYLPHISKGITDIKSYQRIVMQEIYSGIDLQYYSDKKGVKFYYNVKPNGNPDDIIMRFSGAENVILNTDGSLEISSQLGKMKFSKPKAYQTNPAGNVVPMPWQGNYIQISANEFKFEVQNYPHDMPLFIQMDTDRETGDYSRTDNLDWSTYYGGTGNDFFTDVDVDLDGDVYFSGNTNSTNFPRTSSFTGQVAVSGRTVIGAHQSGGVRKWATEYGAQADRANSIAVDNLSNSVYMVGATGYFAGHNDFPTHQKAGAYFLPSPPGTAQAGFATLLQFNKTSGTRLWATLFGEHTAGSYFTATAVDIDEDGNVYMGGIGLRKGNSPILGIPTAYIDDQTNQRKGFFAKGSTIICVGINLVLHEKTRLHF